MKKTEIFILSGFLGSGKTTLLKQRLIQEKKANRKVTVLMNELGQVSIDSDSVDNDIPLKELLNGCICCTLQDQLESQLYALIIEEKPDVIYIETTGVAHPVEMVDAILSPIFVDRLEMMGIITMVDGMQWLQRRSLSPQIQQLLVEQVRYADLLIINKSDLLSEEEKLNTTMQVQSVNTHAQTLLTSFSKVSKDQIEKMKSHPKIASMESHHVHHDLHLSSFVHQFKKSVDPKEFENFIRNVPDTLYRIKGYVKFHSAAHPTLFQYSYGMPYYMKEYVDMPLNMVFIGEKMNWKQVKSGLLQLEGAVFE